MKNKKSKQPLSRKEVRKSAKKLIKGKPRPEIASGGPLRRVLQEKKNRSAILNSTGHAAEQQNKPEKPRRVVDPLIEAEDREIKRLEKLLGIDKGKGNSKAKAATKLNKEFELYEGIGADFGDFLMDLDALTEGIDGNEEDGSSSEEEHGEKQQSTSLQARLERMQRKRKRLLVDDEGDDDDGAVEGHIIDEDEQEESDINSDGDGEQCSDEESNEEDGEQVDDDAESEGNDRESESESSVLEDDEVEASHTYTPATGEDIYGRQTGSSTNGAYVPPAKRAALTAIDENSEQVRLLRRTINGLMNKLSDQSKDTIVRALLDIFRENSTTIASTILKDSIAVICSDTTQLMSTLLPTYAAVIAALHFCYSVDIGAVIVEALTAQYSSSLLKACSCEATDGDDILILSKAPGNALMLLAYLYSLRALHHTLITDLMLQLSEASNEEQGGNVSVAEEIRVELLEQLLNHCGASLRHDDPEKLRLVISNLNKRANVIKSSLDTQENAEGNITRVLFMMETLTDMKSSKIKSAQASHSENVKRLRKWLGSTKNALARGTVSTAGTCLRVSLADLRNADTKGRWWRTGAFWVGDSNDEEAVRRNQLLFGDSTINASNENSNKQIISTSNSHIETTGVDAHHGRDTEEQKLVQLAIKMRLTTKTQQRIFVVMMSSRDIEDAFERLSRLQLKGKEDREVARVIVTCCQTEPSFNVFYAELAKLLCDQQRQYKLTFQYCFWDAFKRMLSEDENDQESRSKTKIVNRKAVNLAKLCAELVCSFHLPLAVLKPIDITAQSPQIVMFMSTLLLEMMKSDIPEHKFQSVMDRVATTKDFAIVRDNIEYFLQKHVTLHDTEQLPADVRKKIKNRRRLALKTMQDMTVLDIARGQMKDEY